MFYEYRTLNSFWLLYFDRWSQIHKENAKEASLHGKKNLKIIYRVLCMLLYIANPNPSFYFCLCHSKYFKSLSMFLKLFIPLTLGVDPQQINLVLLMLHLWKIYSFGNLLDVGGHESGIFLSFLQYSSSCLPIYVQKIELQTSLLRCFFLFTERNYQFS